MIDVAEALRRIQMSAAAIQPRRILLEEAVGLQLQEDVTSDTDSPPWHRSMTVSYTHLTLPTTPYV